jgi:hypothetical protein
MDQELRQVQSIEQRLLEIKNSLGVIDWHVKVALTYEYHCLRFKQQAEKMKIWTKADTARELGLAASTVGENCALAELLKDHDDLRNFSRMYALEYMRKRG